MDSARTLLFRSGIASLFAVTLSASTAAAQTQTPPPPSLPMGTATKPAVVKPAAPLPTDAKIAFVNLEVVFSESEMGKAGQSRWRMFNEKLFATLSAKDKEIQVLSDKIKTQQNVADEAVLKTWNVDLARLQREMQFARQEAQAQSDQLQQEVLAEFGKKVQPVIDALRVEKGLHAIVGIQNEGGGLTLLSSEAGVDLSAELIKRLNTIK